MFQRNFTRITDYDIIFSFLQENNFGQLISDDPLTVTHLPFMIYRDQNNQFLVEGHFAKANNHWKNIDGKDVIIVFTGPHGYITPSVYINKNVPTWNYSAIHLKGEISIINNQDEHKAVLHRLVKRYERNTDKWSINKLDQTILSKQYLNTVSFSVKINQIDAKFKMSQNKTREDQEEIIKHLSNGNFYEKELAKFMTKHVLEKTE